VGILIGINGFHFEQGVLTMQDDAPSASTTPWSGRFNEPVSELVKYYTASVSFDRKLAEFDIQASLAHARMLHAVGILSVDDLKAIEKGMSQILSEIRSGSFEWAVEREDVHSNIESRLVALIGDAGKRLHTGRSRNDQVATDVRLYLRAAIDAIKQDLRTLQGVLLGIAEKNVDTIMRNVTA
jgi:argininosuccinate lyase